MLKIITVLNWCVILFLGFLIAAEALSPARPGGDNMSRGIGQALYYGAIGVFIIMLILNLLPFAFARYLAFAIVAIPALLYTAQPYWRKYQSAVRARMEDARPIYDDPQLDHLARLVRDGETEQFRAALPSPLSAWKDHSELLAYAISEAGHTSFRIEEKTACVRLMFDAGARFDSIRMDVPPHIPVASTGHSTLLRLLLEHGADPNAVQVYFKRPIIFEAIEGYKEPEACVRLLLEFGADPNATAVFSEEDGPTTPLWHAATFERWGICATLIEKGADINFRINGKPHFRQFATEAMRDFQGAGYATKEDAARLRALLQ